MSTSIAANAMSDGDKRQAREVAFEYAVGDATSTRTSRVASGHHIRWVGGSTKARVLFTVPQSCVLGCACRSPLTPLWWRKPGG